MSRKGDPAGQHQRDRTGSGQPSAKLDEVARSTYRWDRLRGVGQGAAETCWQVFALLVAIRVFAADESFKQFIPMGLGVGYLLSPVGLGLVNRLHQPVSRVISLTWLGVALCLTGMAASQSIIAFVACVALAQIVASQGIPMVTHIYSRNYPSRQRGNLLSSTFLIASLVGIGFGYLGGKLLDKDVGLYPLVFATGALAAVLASWACRHIPSGSTQELKSRHPLGSMVVAWNDKLFRMMLIAWMLMGLGNLMLVPLRVEYLANPAYGINASNAQISALLISTVLTFRLLSTKVWGILFDRINVVVLRVFLNTVFTVSILCFFFSTRLWVMAIGCALLGTAFGGGGILWTLFVTKIAVPDKVASYMSVHSFLTGVRMALAPLIGYAVLEFAQPWVAALISVTLITASTFIFLPLKPLIDAKARTLDGPPPQRFSPASPA